MKNSLEIMITQVSLEGGFKRGGRIRVAECLRQIVPNRWAGVRKRSFRNVFVFTKVCGVKGLCVGCGSKLFCWSVKLKEIGQIPTGCSTDGIEADS